jgi:hypothetical protein
MRTALGCLLALTLVTTGCGSDAGAADADRDLRAAAARWVEAERRGDPKATCDELYAEELKRQFKLMGYSCERFVGEGKDPTYAFTVKAVRIHGDRAQVTGQAVEDGKRGPEVLPFVREDGEWRATLRSPEVDPATLDADGRAVVKAVERYSALIRARDTKRLCAELVSKEYEAFSDCVTGEFRGLARASRDYRFSVTEVTLKGNRARVDGHNLYDGLFPPESLLLVREADGRWRLTHEEPK